MANRQLGYGLSAEIANRIASKYSLSDEKSVLSWIGGLTGNSTPKESGQENAYRWLKDGIKLCQAMNVLYPGSIKKINQSSLAFKQMENIGNFLSAAQKYGVNNVDLFQTVDLYENRNLTQVYICVYKLSSVALSKGFPGPHIGIKPASKNQRNFTEAELKKGRTVIGLQMGTNQVASQKGMTAYGTGRQMITKIN